jgi:hypothetical protein
MPEDEFVKTFFLHIREMKFSQRRLSAPELIKIMVMQMADYMVPYEAVRRRLVEVNLLAENASIFLDQKNKGIDQLISTFIKEQNTMLDNSTKKKTIPGLRNLIEEVERKGTGSEYIIGKIKDDFSISRVSDAENIFNINAGE